MDPLLSLCAVAIAICLCNHLVIDREVRIDKAEASRRMAENQRGVRWYGVAGNSEVSRVSWPLRTIPRARSLPRSNSA